MNLLQKRPTKESVFTDIKKRLMKDGWTVTLATPVADGHPDWCGFHPSGRYVLFSIRSEVEGDQLSRDELEWYKDAIDKKKRNVFLVIVDGDIVELARPHGNWYTCTTATHAAHIISTIGQGKKMWNTGQYRGEFVKSESDDTKISTSKILHQTRE